jgi:hypothetical protein
MNNAKGGALVARRWGRILCAGLAVTMASGCATDRESRVPPTHCSKYRARPANPNGSVLVLPASAVSQVQPGATANPVQGGDVMIFGNGADPARPESATDAATVQVPAPTSDAPPSSAAGEGNSLVKPAPAKRVRGRPISYAPSQIRYGSC